MLKVDGIERVVTAAETLANLRPVADSLGLTRLADITGLDRIGIPVYSSIVPRSNDGLSLYNGKGARLIDAKVGAMMEAIERQTALRVRLPAIQGSYSELSRTRNLLDPKRVNQKLRHDYSDDNSYSWIEGHDILSGLACWVPAKLAGYFWRDLPHPSPFVINDSNGLASGNCREEAICHALCELAERDAWTMAELIAHELPRQRRSFVFGDTGKDGSDDLEIFPCLNLGPCELLDGFEQAGLHPVVRDITSSLGIPAAFASVADEYLPGFPMAHSGMGAHPDARVAVRRALTELAQSRCVDIQGVREDLVAADESTPSFALHTRRVSTIDRQSWCIGESVHRRPLSEMASHPHNTITEDLRFLEERFVAAGLDQIIVVDFTPNETRYSVVRVIVPGVEFWAADRGRLGSRAVALWNQHA